MRILYVSQIIPYPPHGGVLQRGYNLLRELAREHDVHLLAFHHPDELHSGEPLQRACEALASFCREVEYFELWPKRSALHKFLALGLAALHPLPFSVLAQRNETLSRRIAGLCGGANPPDILHLDTVALAPYAAGCGHVPAVLTHHNIESRLMERRAAHERGTLQRFYVEAQARRLRRYELDVCGQFPLNITVSAADASLLEEICPGARTCVVPNGVDTDYFQPRRSAETPAVVFTGGMNMFANRDAVEWFLGDIWPLVKAKVPGVRFFAIGQRPSQRVLDAARHDEAVVAPGHVADVRPWVAQAAVYVVPMRVGGGTRLKVLDAMAQGKAIVTTSLGAEGIEASNDAHFILADDARSFAATVVDLIGRPDRRREMGDAARVRVESHYSWRILGKRLGAAYARVVAEHPR